MFEKDGKFYADWRNASGQRIRKSFTSKLAALQYETEQRELAHPKQKAQGQRLPSFITPRFHSAIRRFGVEGGKGTGGQHLPFARAVEADGWLYVSGQVPMVNGEVVSGGIGAQARQAIENLLAILREAGYGPEHVVRCGVWLDDPRDFPSFNAVFREYFGEHPPARACVVSSMVVDCKVEIDCVAYRRP